MSVHLTRGSERIALDLDGRSGTICASSAVSATLDENHTSHGFVLRPARSPIKHSIPWKLLSSDADELVMLATGGEAVPPWGSAVQQLGRLPKRIGDVMIALLALLLFAPLMLAIVLIMKASDPGPLFFAHTRIGRNGRRFSCWKFRTMVLDADERLRKLLAADEHLAEQWRTERKLDNDPRITGLGWVLRKSSIDELPQLINVLRGEMSCVGPRPITADELERYGDTARDYLQVRPGMTGLWQVCGRSQRSYAERVALDRLYLNEWSFGLDLAILLKTIPTLLRFDRTA